MSDVRRMNNDIKLIAIDLDGTLLNSQHELTPRTERALKAAMSRGVQVILATGKTRYSAQEAIARLGLTTPGVYLQGLVIYDGDGTIRHQTVMEPAVVRQIINFGETNDLDLLAYCGTRILVAEHNPQTDRLEDFQEPRAEAVGSLRDILGNVPINKMLIIDTVEGIPGIRAELAAQLNGRATLVQALYDMLEILPLGASKGRGLKRLLDDLDIAPEHVLAIGDGENDVEMLQLAGIGVAMGNAQAPAKEAADVVVAGNDADGVAEAVERFVLSAERGGL